MSTIEKYVKKAQEYFSRDYNCAETILMVMQEYLGEKVDPHLATGFGGGIARRGSICGAITGGVLVISLKYGRRNSTENREEAYKRISKFWDIMEEKYETVVCKELINHPENKTRGTSPQGHHEICNCVVKDAIRTLIQILNE